MKVIVDLYHLYRLYDKHWYNYFPTPHFPPTHLGYHMNVPFEVTDRTRADERSSSVEYNNHSLLFARRDGIWLTHLALIAVTCWRWNRNLTRDWIWICFFLPPVFRIFTERRKLTWKLCCRIDWAWEVARDGGEWEDEHSRKWWTAHRSLDSEVN